MTEEVVRPQCELIRALDGDTFDILVNWRRRTRKPWQDASVVRIRLRDYSAREAKDRAKEDPKGLGRLPGPEATQVAEEVMSSGPLLCEHQGIDSMGREVCWMWIDIDGQWVSLGELLTEKRVVAPGRKEGVWNADRAE